MFGFHEFGDYELGKPIILTEGTKDALVLQQVYPWTLAILSSGISLEGMQIVKHLTQKVILAFDNDVDKKKNVGADNAKLFEKKLQEINVRVKIMTPDSNYGDYGAYAKSGRGGLNMIRVQLACLLDLFGVKLSTVRSSINAGR
jgi:5S rRNA maturation endonuclease (ribonuclease M5)